jgi:hypothetical protein
VKVWSPSASPARSSRRSIDPKTPVTCSPIMKKVAGVRSRSSIVTNAGVSAAGPSSKPIATTLRSGPWR